MRKTLILIVVIAMIGTVSALSFQDAAEKAVERNLTEEIQQRTGDSSLGGQPGKYDVEDLNLEDSAETDENLTKEIAREVNETMEEIREKESKNRGKGLFSAIFQFF